MARQYKVNIGTFEITDDTSLSFLYCLLHYQNKTACGNKRLSNQCLDLTWLWQGLHSRTQIALYPRLNLVRWTILGNGRCYSQTNNIALAKSNLFSNVCSSEPSVS